MVRLFQMSKSMSFRRLWITGLLGAWLSIFAGNATAYCEWDLEFKRWSCFPPSVSINSPANGATYTLPGSVPVTATVTNDPDGLSTISQVAFYVNNTLFQTLTPASYSATYTPPAGGTYTFKA